MSAREPEIIFLNARIHTMDDRAPTAQALAVCGSRIVAIGADEEIRNLARPGVRMVDLHGLTVVPGFNDCHMHILGYGLKLQSANLSPDGGVRDAGALIAALRAWADANPHAPWVRGSGYNQNAFPGAEHVGIADLDRAFPDRPVLIHHASGHAALVNSRALALAGIGPTTAAPAGGEIVRDASGQPTGVLLETAIGLVGRAVPDPSRAEMKAAILRASKALAANGVTSASDMGIGCDDTEAEVGAYRDAVAEGAPLRMTLCPEASEMGSPDAVPDRDDLAATWELDQTPDGVPGSARLGALKLYADGALTTRTAALREPFVDTGDGGMLLHDPAELHAYICRGHDRGWQIATHAIGDRAIDVVLDGYERCGAGSDRRHRIEHCMLTGSDTMRRMVRLGVLAVMQPEFIAKLGDAYVLGLGEARAARLNPIASMLRQGVIVGFSSDCPVVPGAPLDGIRSAMTRTTPSGRVLGADERIGAEQALKAYTRGAAYAVFDECEVGMLAAGMRADFAILSGEAGMPETEVLATVLSGQIVDGVDRLP